jgi:ABC-type multidrug transport system ATPase subunit
MITLIGYCPQFDSFLKPNFTIYDHLNLYCCLNGLDSDIAEEYIDLLLREFGIETFKETKILHLSGGTKRKLSTILATMLTRPVIVLDEASSGLDPLSREIVWKAVGRLNKNRTSIMTSQYINECTVCDRIAVMRNGKIVAFETENNLAKKYSYHYRLTLWLSKSLAHINEYLDQNIFETLNCMEEISESIPGKITVNIRMTAFFIGSVLELISILNKNGFLIDFAFGISSLDIVFKNILKDAKIIEN